MLTRKMPTDVATICHQQSCFPNGNHQNYLPFFRDSNVEASDDEEDFPDVDITGIFH